MGLLGSDWEDPRTMATLQLAAGLLGGGNFGQAASRGLSSYQSAMAAEEDRKIKALQQQAQQQQMQAVAAERMAKVDELRRQQAAAERQQAALAAAFSPGQIGPANTPGGPAINANSMSGIAGPRPEALAAATQPTPQAQPNWQQLIAQGVPAELVKQLAESPDYGRAEVNRTVKGVGPDGREVEYQVDKYGRRVGDGMVQYRAPIQVNQGNRQTFADPYSLKPMGSFDINQSPDSAAQVAAQMRGHNMAAGTAAQRLDFERTSKAADKYEYKQDAAGNWLAFPKAVAGDGPITPLQVLGTNKNEVAAKNVQGVIDQARPLVDVGTSSYLGAGMDQAGRFFGGSNKGADAIAKLRALEGSLMMAQPRMEGPQSDKDVALYRQMAGQIGDPTVPASQKKAALDTLDQLSQRYAPKTAADAAPKPPAGFDALPPANASNRGKIIRDTVTGKRKQSDGLSWKEID